jgi:hypothetical protein
MILDTGVWDGIARSNRPRGRELKMKIDAHRIGLAGGILWGASLFVLTLVSIPTGYAAEFLKVIGSVYLGYHVSLLGSFVGLVYGFVDAYVGLYLLLFLYARLPGGGGIR